MLNDGTPLVLTSLAPEQPHSNKFEASHEFSIQRFSNRGLVADLLRIPRSKFDLVRQDHAESV